jgi:hypothetical protein
MGIKVISSIEKLFKSEYPDLTPIVTKDGDDYLIHIEEEYEIDDLNKLYIFFNDKTSSKICYNYYDLDFYKIFKKFIPNKKISIFVKQKDYEYRGFETIISRSLGFSGATYIVDHYIYNYGD